MNEADARALARDVLGAIAPEADLAAVSDEQDLREALDLDSMDFLNFVIGLHTGSGRSILEADYPRLYTLGGVVGYLAG